MSYEVQPTWAANTFEKNHYNDTRSRGGPCTLDTDIGQTALGIYVQMAGDVVLEGVDGDPNFLPSLTAGFEHKFKFRRVLTSAVINSITYTTTATGLFWVGGES